MPPLSRNVRGRLLKSLPTDSPDSLQQDVKESFDWDPESSDEDKNNDIPTFKPKGHIESDPVVKEPIYVQEKAKASRLGSRPAPNPLIAKPFTSTRSMRQNAQDKTETNINHIKRKRGIGQKEWDDADELGDDEFNVIRESSAPAKPNFVPDDFGENVHFGSSQTRGSQSKSYGSSQRKIHANPSSRKKTQKPSQEQKSSFRIPTGSIDSNKDDSTSTTSFKMPKTRGTTPLQETNQNAKFQRPRTPPPTTSWLENGPSSPLTILTSDLSSPPPSSILEADEPVISISPMSSPEAYRSSKTVRCPICREDVDKTFYNTFLARSGRTTLRTKDKLRFCESHTAATAKETWSRSDYPTIDWSRLPRRLEKLDTVVEDLLSQRIHSVYRRELEDAMHDSNTNIRHALRKPQAMSRSAAETALDDVITIPDSSAQAIPSSQLSDPDITMKPLMFGIAGYYGTRGAKFIMEHVTGSPSLSSKLRAVSAREDVFKAIGVAGFIQAVIVPEIAWRLVREDVGLGSGRRTAKRRKDDDDEEEEGEKRAKEILIESRELGEVVYGEDESELRQTQRIEFLDDDDFEVVD